MIPFTGFAPDVDQAAPGILTSVTSMLPTVKGYKGAPSAITAGYPALASACYGAAIVRKLDNTTRFIVGVADKLYEGSGLTWTDRSGSAYNANQSTKWRFAQYGNVTIAANRGDLIQSSITGAFADIAGSPKADYVCTVGEFVCAASTVYGGDDFNDAWHCSALSDYTNWTPNIATQCATGRLTSIPGRITASKRLGDYWIIYKDRGIYVGTYAGPPYIWDWREIPGSVGASSHESVIDIGNAHIIVGEDNFYLFDGSQARPIGNVVKDWFLANASTSWRSNMQGIHDPINGLVYLYFTSTASADGNPDKCLVYNYRVDKWGSDDRVIECAIQYTTPALTYDDFGTLASTWDDLPNISFESAIFVANRPIPAVIDAAHTAYSLTGACASWGYTTGDIGDDAAVVLLSRVKPRFALAPTTATMTNYYRMDMGDALIEGATTSMSNARFDVLRAARWHRLAFAGTGDTEIYGIRPTLAEDGSE